MKRKFKITSVVAVTLISLFIFSVSSFAVESNIDQYAEEFDLESVISSVDDETLRILKEIGIDEISYESVFSIEPSKVFRALFNMVSTALKEPLQFTVITMGVLMLATLL